jgi:hypothetical protein
MKLLKALEHEWLVPKLQLGAREKANGGMRFAIPLRAAHC